MGMMQLMLIVQERAVNLQAAKDCYRADSVSWIISRQFAYRVADLSEAGRGSTVHSGCRQARRRGQDHAANPTGTVGKR